MRTGGRRRPTAGSQDNGLARRLAAEFIGTALLVTFGAGSVVAALRVGGGTLGYGALGFVALAFGLVIAAVVFSLGSISGAHINSAATIALAIVRRFNPRDVLPYVISQAAGALFGGLLILGVFGHHAAHSGFAGATTLGHGVSSGQGALAEAIGTFLLMTTVMALAIDKRAPTGWAALTIGLVVSCEILVFGPVSGESVNPARTFGPYAIATIFGAHPPWHEFWIYCIGPVIGAIGAAAFYEALARPPRNQPGRPVTSDGTMNDPIRKLMS